MKKIKAEDVKKAGVLSAIVICGIAFIVVAANMYSVDRIGTGILNDGEMRHGIFRQVYLPFLGDADPGTGASGVLMVYVNATNTSGPAVGTEYNSNLTTAYATGTVNNSHISSDIPYGTNFDVIVKVRWNKTHAYDTAWNLSLVRAYANSTVLGVTGILMNESQITDSADYLYVNYYLHDNDGGAGTGFTIAEGQNVTGFSVNFESLFYP